MVRTRIILVLLVAVSYKIFAQNDSLNVIRESNRIILDTDKISGAVYYVYNPPFSAMAIYQNINQITNEYPEELMSSILCASNQEWVDFNTLGGSLKSEKLSNKEIQEVKNINPNTTYFELLSKLEFTANNSKTAIIKFYLHKEGLKKPVAGAIAMQQEDGKWKKTSAPYLSKIAMALLVFKADVLERLLTDKSNNEYEKKIIESVYNNEGFDFGKLLQIKLNNTEKEYLTNPLNW